MRPIILLTLKKYLLKESEKNHYDVENGKIDKEVNFLNDKNEAMTITIILNTRNKTYFSLCFSI